MNIKSFSLFFCILVSVLGQYTYGSYRACNRISTAYFRAAFAGSGKVPMRVPHMISSYKTHMFAFQSRLLTPKATNSQRSLFFQNRSKHKSHEESSSKNEWFKRKYGSPLLGTGIAFSLLDEQKAEPKSLEETDKAQDNTPRAILLTKEDVLQFGVQYKKEFIACAMQYVASSDQKIIEAIVAIIEKWPAELHELKVHVLKLSSQKVVSDKIIAALDKVHPTFSTLYKADIYSQAHNAADQAMQEQQQIAQEKLEANQKVVDQVIERNILSPAVSSVLFSIPVVAYYAITDSSQDVKSTIQSLPLNIASGVATTVVSNAALGFLGVKCPAYDKDNSNVGYYTCNAFTKLVVPLGAGALVNTYIFPK